MRGIFRRRNKKDDDIIEGEIEEIHDDAEEVDPDSEAAHWMPPLERVAPEIPTPDESALTPYIPPPRQERQRRAPSFRFRIPRLLAWEAVNPALLLLALGLVVGGVFWTMYNLGQTSPQAEQWYPALLLGFALLWALYALLARRPGTFLAASALIGVGISLLLDAQDLIAWRQTLVASVLITAGMGIVARGFLLRQGTAAR